MRGAPIVAGAAVVAVVGAGVAFTVVVTTRDDAVPMVSPVASHAAAPSPSPVMTIDAAVDIGRYPGLGVTEEQRRRDDAIALYEAWQRAVVVRSCMADAGYDWRVAVAFPAQTVVAVATWMRVPPASAPGPDPSQHNSDLLHTFTRPQVNRIFDALYGAGGCDDQAWDAVGTVAEITSILGDDLSAWREARGAAEPGDIAALDREFERSHAEELASWAERYVAVIEVAERDGAFMTFLAEERARLE